jgi:hypothetical protein
MFLTCPVIDQAVIRFEPQNGILSEIAIVRQQLQIASKQPGHNRLHRMAG